MVVDGGQICLTPNVHSEERVGWRRTKTPLQNIEDSGGWGVEGWGGRGGGKREEEGGRGERGKRPHACRCVVTQNDPDGPVSPPKTILMGLFHHQNDPDGPVHSPTKTILMGLFRHQNDPDGPGFITKTILMGLFHHQNDPDGPVSPPKRS